MKHLDQSAINLLSNRLVFEEIHQLKSFFTLLFSEVANGIPLSVLTKTHSGSQGTKISKGNELQQCPYQVLDIIRDFDYETGFNIRLLNWWGRGLYVFVFVGKNNKKLRPKAPFLPAMRDEGFRLTKTNSLWDYPKIIDHGCMESTTAPDQIEHHVSEFNHVQMVKQIAYSADYDLLMDSLSTQVRLILDLYIR